MYHVAQGWNRRMERHAKKHRERRGVDRGGAAGAANQYPIYVFRWMERELGNRDRIPVCWIPLSCCGVGGRQVPTHARGPRRSSRAGVMPPARSVTGWRGDLKGCT